MNGRRHDLLRLRPAAWPGVVEKHDTLEVVPLLRDWIAHGRPVMRRRRLPDEAQDCIAAAIALPAGAGPRRVGFTVPADAVLSAARPPSLSEVAHAAPAAWADTVRDLLAAGHRYGAPPRVFGSLMWQAITGLDYLAPASDLDLLWMPGDTRGLTALLDAIAAVAGRLAPPLDGEIEFRTGEAVHWSELRAAIVHGTDGVIAKSLDTVRLLRFADLGMSRAA